MNINVNQTELIRQYLDGDASALQNLLAQIQDLVFNLSVKMLFSIEDAEDATQEILIKVIKSLPQFRGDSRFSTWVYAIARNHLISVKMKRAETQEISFDLMSKDLQREMPYTVTAENEYIHDVAVADLKIGCTQAMLLCLDREQRLMFILSKMYQMNSVEGAQVFAISPQTYRKRLSRITQKMQNFLNRNCGLVNTAAVCKCHKRLAHAIEMKRVNPFKPYFIEPYATQKQIEKVLSAMEEFDDESWIFRTNPAYRLNEDKVQEIMSKIQLN